MHLPPSLPSPPPTPAPGRRSELGHRDTQAETHINSHTCAHSREEEKSPPPVAVATQLRAVAKL